MKNEKGPFFILQVKVTPRSHKSEVVSYEERILKVRLRALPEKGDANAELVRILNLQEVKDRFAGLGVEAVPSTQAQFGQTINTEIAKFAKLIKDVGIKIE